MEKIYTKILLGLFLLPVIVISGIYLRKKARPYNNILFTAHKIVAVVYLIFTVLVIINFIRDSSREGILPFLLALTASLILFSFITGALQSFEKPPPAIINIIHKVSSYLIIICLPLIFILLCNFNI
jgi:predicted neutral ceramidase superfamily lipid hydrolase